MAENSFKSIRNATIATILGGIVLLIIPTVRGYIISLFEWLWSGVIWIWNSLLASYALPGWILIILILLAIIGIFIIIELPKGSSKKPEHYSYVEDFIHGTTWRWYWIENGVENLWCYCPTCDATLVYNDRSCTDILSDRKETLFICENCDNKIVTTITGGNVDYACGVIIREIDRRIRTNSYKKH